MLKNTLFMLRKKRPVMMVSVVFFLVFLLMMFVQIADYVKNYFLYVRAKGELIKAYKEGSSVKGMDEQSKIVDYLGELSVEGATLVFYTAATFTFVAAMLLMIAWGVRKLVEKE